MSGQVCLLHILSMVRKNPWKTRPIVSIRAVSPTVLDGDKPELSPVAGNDAFHLKVPLI
jgi:hypothetical protein